MSPWQSSWRSPGQWCWILMTNWNKNEPKYFERMVLVLIWWYSYCSATLMFYLGAKIWKWEIAKINHFWHLCYVGFDFDKNASYIVRCNSISVLYIFFTNSVSAAFSKKKPKYVLEWLNSIGFLINLPVEIRVGEKIWILVWDEESIHPTTHLWECQVLRNQHDIWTKITWTLSRHKT